MSTFTHLGRLLRGRWFRRLFAVRVTSQFGDGVFQVALASYVLFSPEKQASPEAIAGVLAVVLLPFSILGPFAGVFLDRWPRRQVLALSNAARMLIVLGLAVLVSRGVPDPVFYAVVLTCLSVNRFVLAGLSASLPHTVEASDLVTANALTPTMGALAALAGAGAGALMRDRGDVTVLVTAAVVYGAAAALALRIPRHLLGPDFDPARPAVAEAVRHVVRGLVEGLRHLAGRRRAAYALGAIGAHRFFYGLSAVAAVLLYRNYFHDAEDSDAAFAGLSGLVAVSGLGFLAAAVLTPVVVERVSHRTWIVGLLGTAAVTQIVPGALYTNAAVLVSGFFLGLAGQGIKICVDTLVQLEVVDAFRGRVFSVYDVLFNIAFAGAAAVGALVLPDDGKSYAVLLVIAAGYAVTAVVYARLTRPVAAGRTQA